MRGTQIRRRSDNATLTIAFVEPSTYVLTYVGHTLTALSQAEMLRAVRRWHAGEIDHLFA